MEDLNNRVANIVSGKEEALIGNTAINWESHGFVIGVFFSVDTALGVTVSSGGFELFIIQISTSVVDSYNESEFHTFGVTLGEEHPVGDTTGSVVFSKIKFALGFNSCISIADEGSEAGNIRNGHRGLGRLPLDVVASSRHCKREKCFEMKFYLINAAKSYNSNEAHLKL